MSLFEWFPHADMLEFSVVSVKALPAVIILQGV
jgi:hypothetical protein